MKIMRLHEIARRRAIFLLTAFWFMGLLPAGLAADLTSGEYFVTQSWSQETGFKRPYYVSVPQGVDQRKLPVFIFLHGNGGNAKGAMKEFMKRYPTISGRYILLFAEGYLKSWNIVSERSKADDRGFIEAIVQKLSNHDNVQKDRFSIMGVSNGAALINQLAIESRLPHIRNYISSVSPLNVFQHDGENFKAKGGDNSYQVTAKPSTGKRLMNISGTEDDLVPYRGGPSSRIPAKDGRLGFVAAEESIFIWARQMGHTGGKLAGPSRIEGNREIFSYLGGDVIHYKVVNEGHGATRSIDDETLLAFLDGDGLRLNEILASNRAGPRDDEGKRSDWVELLNFGPMDVELAGYRLTDDPEQPNKWTFPDHRVSSGDHFLVWMSGREENPLAPGTLTSSEGTVRFDKTLIEQGAEWRYLHRTPGVEETASQKRIPADWMAVEFDDRQFAVGQAGFGYGDEDDATEVPTGTTVVLLRHEFDLENLPPSESLVLQVDYDDGFVAYLNGERVAAVNAPDDTTRLDAVATASHDAGVPSLFDLSAHAGLLRVGKNVMAIAGLNNSAGSSDLSLHPALGTLPPICHANFTLKMKGGALYLFAPDGDIVDQIEFPEQTPDRSLGRSADKGDWGYFLTPTPGLANSRHSQSQPVDPPSFAPEPGGFDENVEVRLLGESSPGVEIRYTIDGTEPNASSTLYRTPVTLVETTLVRAAAFSERERASSVVSATYLIGWEWPRLPVLSISMKPADFDEVQLRISATGPSSERNAFMEFIEKNGERTIATGFGLRLHGGAGRNGGLNTKKSYRTYFRKSYGVGRLDGRIIPEAEVEDFDKLVLRASSNDRATHGSSIRDQVIRDLHSDMGALAARGSWCVLLVNSTNRGVYNITERMDEEFLASHLGPGEYDVIKTGETVLSGSKEGWDDLRRFVATTDFSDDVNLEKLSQRVDIAKLTSYMIVNMCLQNFDWPHNNWYAARRIPDGKWIFLCWDAEWGLGYRHPGLGDAPYGIDVDPYAFMDSGGAYGNSLIRKLFLALIDNPGYCDFYQQEVRKYLSGPLSTGNIMRHIRRHRDAIAADIEVEYRARGQNTEQWLDQIKEVEHFALNSPAFFQRYTDEYFSFRGSPVDEDRMAMIEDPDGRLHVIHRDGNGRLRDLNSSMDGTVWSEEAIRVPATAPPATGSPCVYSLSPGDRRILYRGTKGHLHELSLSEGAADDEVWKHTNLTALLQMPPASCDPSVVVVAGVPHIVYVDEKSRLRELWLDGLWRQQALPAAPRPASGAIVSASPEGLHVTYRTMFDVPCEQILYWGAISDVSRPWTHRLIQSIPSEGQPIGLEVNGRRRIIFQPAKEWSLREPFIFQWNGQLRRGYREYDGPRNGLIQAWDQRQRFHHLEPVGNPTTPAAGNPLAVLDPQRGRYYIAYRDAAGHIQEAFREPGATPSSAKISEEETWRVEDVTTLAGAPPAAEDPAGIVAALDGTRYYIFRGRDGKLHEVRFNGRWSHREITAAAGSAGTK